MRVLDTMMALRVVYLLVTPVQNTEAFKLGLIDADGKTIKKAETAKEKNATSMLHRLCWNLKRIIGLIPGGSSKIGSLTAAYLLMKEAYENEWTEDQLNESAVLNFNTLCESNEVDEDLSRLLDQLADLYEDAPANASSSGGTFMPDTGGVAKNDPKLGLVKRKKLKAIELPE